MSDIVEGLRKEAFTVVKHNGASCVMEPIEAEAMLAESDEQYTISTVMLTRDEFERMPDFQGF